MRRLAVALAGLLVALAAGCDSGTSPSPSPQAATQTAKSASPTAHRAAVGQSVLISGGEGMKVTVTLVSVQTYKQGTGHEAEPPEHGWFLVADMKVAVGSMTYRCDPAYFTLISPDGTTHKAFEGHAEHAGYGPMLSAGTLKADQSTSGNVTFDVPSQHGVLRMTDPIGGTAEWDV